MTGRKIHPRPISISASGKSGQLHGFEELKPPKDAKTAKQIIFETGGVGVDIRALARKDTARKDTAAAVPNTFMKPAGVDEPKETQPPSLSSSKQILDYARQKSSKRQRESIVTGSSEMSTKAKKKRKKNSDS
jgi:hypothetical protein